MGVADFPNLVSDSYEVTSPATAEYNCIAYAAGDRDNWWWPDLRDSYWPKDVLREYSIDSFIQAYRQSGQYEPCVDGSLEEGYEKIAIYGDQAGPLHAAWQRDDGHWSSKLGPSEDIRHDTLERLTGDLYGAPIKFLKRPRKSAKVPTL
jgi:hypothetical protein